jgi:hypothetical protein
MGELSKVTQSFHNLMDLMPQHAEIGDRQSDGYHSVQLTLNNTIIHCRYYATDNTACDIVSPRSLNCR